MIGSDVPTLRAVSGSGCVQKVAGRRQMGPFGG